MAKVRLDTIIHNRGLAISREKAQALVLAGLVEVEGKPINKAGTKLDETVDIKIKGKALKYVSRGGLKLEAAIKEFNVDFNNKVVLDVGASTGGYTDCALQHGAAKVFALDVGYGQLDWTLRNNSKVVNIERTNIRYFTPDELGEKVDIITMDVSFISTTIIFPVIKNFIKAEGEIISLIKPQFEAGREKVGKNGVIRDPKVHLEVLHNCILQAANNGLNCVDVCYSPIAGPKGNIEFFIYLKQNKATSMNIEESIENIVQDAHKYVEGIQ